MKKMWTASFIMAAVMAGVLLGGCSGGNEAPTEAETDAKETVTETAGEDGEISGTLEIQYFVGGYGDAWWKWVIEDFKKAYPNVEIVEYAAVT